MNNFKIVILSSLLVLFTLLFFMVNNTEPKIVSLRTIVKIDKPAFQSSISSENMENIQERFEYEFARLKDPITNKIPSGIRAKELSFAKKLPNREDLSKAGENSIAFGNWRLRGPGNVGGRTRALAVDLDYNGSSNKKILAGGVSGGMYLSNNDGISWTRTTSNSSLPSVTCLAQDPTNKNVWYYGTGESIGNSAGGALQNYLGEGIFKSTNGGVSWTQLPSTYQGGSLTSFDNVFDIVWNIAVNSQSGAVYAATIGTIQLSTDGGNTWSAVLVGQDASNYLSQETDVTIASNNDVYATLSKNGINLNTGQFGIFRSTNGTQFTNISPTDLASDPYRMVLASAPSDPNILYVLVQVNSSGATAQDHQLFKYNAGTNSWTNLSSNLPNESGADGNASFCSQRGYDLIVKVKPDNPNVIWIGGTNLYRSTNGGDNFTRVGGYANSSGYTLYENSHSDFHSMTFYPNNPNAMINGHDGGLSKTDNDLEQPQTWTKLNNNYITSQFYCVAIDPQIGNNNFIIGGLQDNGSWGTESSTSEDDWFDLLSGDGGFAAVAPGASDFYVSSQNGNVVRYSLQNSQYVWSVVAPQAQNFQFITPYLLDPNNPDVMYIAAGNAVWRNSSLSGIPQGNQDPTSINWTELTNSAIANTNVTTLSVSKQPANRLYFGATDYQSKTYIIRVNNPGSNPTGTDITPSGITGGSFPSCIGINPNNADEIIVTFANYNVPGIWYSNNGGTSWSNIEGNLSGENGPSIRWATIAPSGGYFLATSTGIYSTQTLAGNGTTWGLEAADVIGNVVVNILALRPEDGFFVAGTHGRGVYSTVLETNSPPLPITDVQSLTLQSYPGQSGDATFTLSNQGGSPLTFDITVTGDLSIIPSKNNSYILKDSHSTKNIFSMNNNDLSKNLQIPGSIKANNFSQSKSGKSLLGTDVIILDDGNDIPDQFFGWYDGSDLGWYNEFTLSGNDFILDSFQFYMRSTGASQNDVHIGVFDSNGNSLTEGDLSLQASANGDWFVITLDSPINFNDGDTFVISIMTMDGYIEYPAGTDYTAAIPNKSYYYDGSTWVNLNTISGFENAAFLIRAVGTFGGGTNQNPLAVANVNPTQANINEMISFDASASSDPDGQITQYLWDFGDGTTSNQITISHSYSQANNYNYTLTVTDNNGATDQVSGQLTISQIPSSKVTVVPSSGTISAGGSQVITLTLDASNITEGTYTGQVNITTNGGNIVIPIDYVVDVKKEVGLPIEYTLAQNYPNPFNPTTTIKFGIPENGFVTLDVFDMLGRKVRTLVNREMQTSFQTVEFDASSLASGVYVYRLKVNNFISAKKLLLMK